MTDFHKVWIEQCEAAEGIRDQFGVADATRYLVGEKLFRFMQVSQERSTSPTAHSAQAAYNPSS